MWYSIQYFLHHQWNIYTRICVTRALVYIGLDKLLWYIDFPLCLLVLIFFSMNMIFSKWTTILGLKTICSIEISLEKLFILFSPLPSWSWSWKASAPSYEKLLIPCFVTYNLKHICIYQYYSSTFTSKMIVQ